MHMVLGLFKDGVLCPFGIHKACRSLTIEQAAYFKNTRHGGGSTHSIALHELFDWFYRGLISRTMNCRKARESELARAVQVVSRNIRQCSWRSSTGRRGVAHWLQGRIR